MLHPPHRTSSLPAPTPIYAANNSLLSLKMRDGELPALPAELESRIPAAHNIPHSRLQPLRHLRHASLSSPSVARISLGHARYGATYDSDDESDGDYSSSQEDLLVPKHSPRAPAEGYLSLGNKVSPPVWVAIPCFPSLNINLMARLQATAGTTRGLSTDSRLRSTPFMRSDGDDPTAGVLVTVHRHQVVSEPWEHASSAKTLGAVPLRDKPLPIPVDVLVDVEYPDKSEARAEADKDGVQVLQLEPVPLSPSEHPHVAHVKRAGKRRKHYTTPTPTRSQP
ncbi:hypothetical protein MIND_00165300 [Mycena indigotica]|uniref:Uncharacterized protein n=1 Tax=Mycena indigotica TaxID=2126181 RepID=A0A8H6TGR9_9AGAR|nr:uncharacterized protein MIND_00165300 [Mycena indigotica]KAF7316462.1 hypothetical protein MIND_00165300 [Mycena indigotica]